ncbi:MAG: sigma-70 family RNA polymerase sigma factor [Rickettsiales bacterium]
MVDNAATDRQLLERITAGDHAAFAALVKMHSLRFYRVAYRFLGNRERAEDMVQEAFLKLWENPSIWNPGSNAKFTTWFYRVVVNLCLDAKKKYTPLQLAEDFDAADEAETQEEALIETEKRALLDKEINDLPERQKTAVVLCFMEGLSNQEAAEVMGLQLKALQSLLMRAKERLSLRLKAYREVA